MKMYSDGRYSTRSSRKGAARAKFLPRMTLGSRNRERKEFLFVGYYGFIAYSKGKKLSKMT